ncbi:MAG: HD domain-containing protein [Pseudomonadota bacterium]
MTPESIIRDYYPPGSQTLDILLRHAEQVAKKGLEIARRVSHLEPDTGFIEEAAMLHDIGIFMTRAPAIGCFGGSPYICHGLLGRNLLESIELPRHALVSERHTGAGISRDNIIEHGLPLPLRDMIPLSIEEIIVCVADKYFSKNPSKSDLTMTRVDIFQELKTIDASHGERFSTWADLLGIRS